jgi:HAD superfamily hydrolase (TIGR01509 family)
MTTYRLGINTCFAVKRWPQPGRWAQLVRDELGLDLVQHSLDLVDFDAASADVRDQAFQLQAACADKGLTLHSTFTGLAAYSSNLLLHPDWSARDRARDWYRQVIRFTAEAGAGSTGGHLGAFSVDDWHDPGRQEQLWEELDESLAELAAYARAQGLSYLMAENLAAAREPSTMAMISSLLTNGDRAHVPVKLCLDVGHQCVPGTEGEDRNPYAWLERLGARAPVVQLQQSDGVADHHWPFTAQTNAVGIIEARRVLAALDRSGAAEVALILEIIPPFEQDDDQVRKDLRESVAYWQTALDEHARGDLAPDPAPRPAQGPAPGLVADQQQSLRGVIFDMDGVVVDSEPLSMATIAEMINEYGGHADPAMLMELTGVNVAEVLALAAARSGLAINAADLYRSYEERYLPRLRASAVRTPGLTRLITELRAASVPLALASSSPLAEIEVVVHALGLGTVLRAIASAEEVDRPKPAPDVYHLAIQRLRAGPAGLVAIEDSATGAAAANAASLTCVGVRTAFTQTHVLGGVALIVNSLEELDPATLQRLAQGLA